MLLFEIEAHYRKLNQKAEEMLTCGFRRALSATYKLPIVLTVDDLPLPPILITE